MLVSKALKVIVPVANDVIGAALSEEQLSGAKHELDLMRTLVDKLPASASTQVEMDPDQDATRRLTINEGNALREFRSFLFSLDRSKKFGGLHREQGPSGDYLWVCDDHRSEYDPGLPTIESSPQIT